MKGKSVGENVKECWIKWMEAVGNTASDVANSTRYKVEEAKLLSKRQSIMDRLGETAYVLWQKGESFPAKLDEMLKALEDTNGKLNTLHSEHLAWINEKEKAARAGNPRADEKEPDKPETDKPETVGPEVTDSGCKSAAEEVVHEAETAVEAAVEAVYSAEEAIVAEIPDTGSETEKNGSADAQRKPLVEEMNVKLDGMIDRLGSSLKKLGTEIDQGLNRISDRLVGPQETGDARTENGDEKKVSENGTGTDN